MHNRLVNAAALAAALTVPLVLVAFLVIVSARRCRTEPGGPPCPDVWVADPDGSLWRATIAVAVVQLLIVGGRAGWLAFQHVEGRLGPAVLVAVAVIALGIGPVAAPAELSGLALVSLLCPLVLVAVRRTSGRRAALMVLAALLPSCLFFPFWEGDWGPTTSYPLLFWALTLPVTLVRHGSQSQSDRPRHPPGG